MLVNGEPVGISKDARTPAEFDVTEPRSPRRPQRARRRRRALVGRELRRGPGSVVARRASRASPSPSRRSSASSYGHAGRRLPRRALHVSRAAGSSWRGSSTRAAGLLSRGAAERAVRGACARRDCGRQRSLALYTLVVTRRRGERHDVRVGFRRTSRSATDSLLVNGEPVADRRGQSPRSRRHAGPGGHARADGAGRAADEAVQHQRRPHLALPERPVLARPLRPARPLRRRRGEHRVARVLRRALPRPALSRPLRRARARTWSSATRTIRA